jgi:hypothetical protein
VFAESKVHQSAKPFGRLKGTEDSPIMAVADLEGSELLLAVTATVWLWKKPDGAVYNPTGEIVPAPAGGLIAHVTEVSDAFWTDAANCWICPALRPAADGTTETVTGGNNVILAEPVWLESTEPVAVTVTVWLAEMGAGAV